MSDSKVNNYNELVKEAPPFRRAQYPNGSRNTADAIGRVKVFVQLHDSVGAIRGNITRSFTIAEARVSDVAAYVERALFGDDVAA